MIFLYRARLVGCEATDEEAFIVVVVIAVVDVVGAELMLVVAIFIVVGRETGISGMLFEFEAVVADPVKFVVLYMPFIMLKLAFSLLSVVVIIKKHITV